MNLLAFGDYNYGDPTVYPEVNRLLCNVCEQEEIKKIVAFDLPGISSMCLTWADEMDIPKEICTGDAKYSIKSGTYRPNNYLRDIVDAYEIDAFFFMFLGNLYDAYIPKDESEHRNIIRELYGRAKKAFKKQKIYTNYVVPPL